MNNVAEQLKQRITEATYKEQKLIVEILALMPRQTDESRKIVLRHLDEALSVARSSVESSGAIQKVILGDHLIA